ncbi:hypothetical protein [Nocardia stercoris]|uniref:Uncharacterized protein n=1 Tax=Nocardia stercoris TaxID=2483361 RepID=A0A3M2L2Q1_9NOCA|nr:hypothetical protein [Nocardia stercoris]RMI31246.1 hypothetical protein EBN03_17890 [Nocardia stercoris]
MASRDIVVTVGEQDWLVLDRAAECAGMSVPDYVRWGVRLLALQSQPGAAKRAVGGSVTDRPAADCPEVTESAAWIDSFAQRLSGRADR